MTSRGFGAALTAAMSLMLGACATPMQAPSPPFNMSGTDSLIQEIRLTPVDVRALLDATHVEDRNRLLRRLIADIDVHYLEFSQAIASSDVKMGAITGLLGMGAGVASSLTGSAGVKANYSALGTLLTGGSAVFDSNFLHGQTTSALVSAMDDQRAAVQLEIRRSMSQAIEEYPGQTAFADAILYYRAGTLASAALHLQQVASGSAAKSMEALRAVPIPTDAEVAAEIAVAEDLEDLIKGSDEELLRRVLIELQVPSIDKASSREALQKAAFGYLRNHRDKKIEFAAKLRPAKS